MSDVRKELVAVMKAVPKAYTMNEPVIADAILERFEVTPKPVVSDEDLGGMVYAAYCEWEPATQHEGLAERMRWYLNRAGLKIVRVDE